MKEIGGYFELELSLQEEYHNNSIKLNSARNAFKYILKSQHISKVYVPNYICDSVIEPLDELDIDYEFYNINENFDIINDIYLKGSERIFYVNYFGLKNKYIKTLCSKYKLNLIIDNTQAFYEFPLDGIDTIYSPRKFVGVSDGGYLYTKYYLNEKLEIDYSFDYYMQLIGRIDQNASIHFKDYQNSEKRLINQSIKQMSKLTSRILCSIDYDDIKTKRERNFYYLHSQLGKINQLKNDFLTMSVPFVYPFMSSNTSLRNKLIESKIYIAKYWSEALNRKTTNEAEIKFVNCLFPLPIDHRYALDDMKRIVDIIMIDNDDDE